MKKIIFTFLCVFAFAATSSYAMDVKFDRDTQMVTIDGTAGANESIAVIINNSSLDGLENVTAEQMQENSIGFYEVKSGDDGKYNVTFKSDDVDGAYSVLASGEETVANSQVELYSSETLTTALTTFSTAVSQGESAIFEALKDENLRKVLGVNELYNSIPDKTILAKELAKNQGYDSYAGLETALIPVKCCEKFNNMINKVQVKELVREMKEAYGGKEEIYNKYFGLNNTDSIDGEIYKKKPYKDISEVYSVFERTVTEYQIPSIGGPGGSGSGGVSSFPAMGAGVTTQGQMTIPTQTMQTFKDVTPGFWGYEAIEGLYKMGIVSGISKEEFAPNQAVKREEFVKMLVELTGLNATEKQDTFTDTNKSAWYSPYLAIAQECGLAFGKEDGSFGIGEVLTRQDMAVLAARVLGTGDRGVAVTFEDAGDISEYARNSIEVLCGLKIMSGTGDGKFTPKATATRAQAAKVIYEIAQIMK